MKVKGFKDTIAWYDKNASSYAKAIGDLAPLNYINKFSKLLSKNGRVLEVGCAGGRDAEIISEKGFKVTGVDLSKNLLKQAKKQAPKANFVQADFLNLPFSNGFFDGIWSSASLLHLETVEEVERALKEFKRVLKKGGIVFISVKAQIGSKKFKLVKDKLVEYNRFFQFFKKRELESLLKKAGLKVFFINQEKDTDKVKNGRKDVEWINCFAKKE
jgi:ubiquinone/menaquinone biosynthesis C-methylase UbiE